MTNVVRAAWPRGYLEVQAARLVALFPKMFLAGQCAPRAGQPGQSPTLGAKLDIVAKMHLREGHTARQALDARARGRSVWGVRWAARPPCCLDGRWSHTHDMAQARGVVDLPCCLAQFGPIKGHRQRHFPPCSRRADPLDGGLQKGKDTDGFRLWRLAKEAQMSHDTSGDPEKRDTCASSAIGAGCS